MIRLFLLGSADVLSDAGERVTSVIAQPKRFGLLAYLTVQGARGPRRRDELLALFWPELDASRARRGLTYSLYFLRRELGQGLFKPHGAADLLLDPDYLWCDVAAFEREFEDGRFEEALAYYRGDFMEGFYNADTPELEQWADGWRLRLHERARTSAWTLVERASRTNSHASLAETARWARRALELAPDDERALRALLTALHAIGDVSGMAAEYEHFARAFDELHGVPPSPLTCGLVDTLRATPRLAASPEREGSARTRASAPAPLIQQVFERTPVQRRWRAMSPPRVSIAAGAALALGALGFSLASNHRLAPPAADPVPIVAVIPFAYHGAPDLTYTSDGLTTLLAAGIDHLGGFRTVNPRVLVDDKRPIGAELTPERAAAIAGHFGARVFVLGDIIEAGRRLRITASLYDERARVVRGPVILEASADSLFELVDGLAAQLSVRPRRGADDGVSIGAVNGTRSIPALRAFLDGEHAFRTGQHEEAIASYRRALAADSGFALALLRMSQAANWTGDFRLQTTADAQLQTLLDRLSPSQRRRAEAWHESMTARPERADSVYQSLVAEDPTDVEGWYYLADLVFHQGPAVGWPAAESRPSWERVLALEPNDASALIHLARIAAANGDESAFDSLSRRVASVSPSDDMIFELRTLRAFAFGTAGERAAVVSTAARRPGRLAVAEELVGHAAAASRDGHAVTALWAAIDHDVPNAEAHGVLVLHRASVMLAQGHLHDGLALIDSAQAAVPSLALRYRGLASALPFLNGAASKVELASLARVRHAVLGGDTIAVSEDAWAWRDFLLGTVALRIGDGVGAARASSALDARAAGGDMRAALLAPVLRAQVTARDGRFADALVALGARPGIGMWIGDPSASLASARERWVRADLLARLGRDREALRLLESIPESTGSDLAYAPAAQLRQGELFERLGDRAEATRHFRRALGYWRHADPEFASLIARARDGLRRVDVGRVAGLTTSQ